MDLTPTKQRIKELEAKVKEAEARRVQRAEEKRLKELLEQATKARHEDEEEAFEAELAEMMPDKALGVHYDFSRFGEHLVAYGHDRPAHDIFVKKLPDKGQANPSEVMNYVTRSLIRVDEEIGEGEGGPARRGAAFGRVAAEFGGAPNACAQVLLELAKGGTAVRTGK